MTVSQHQTDVVVIGAGPVGLFAVFELGMLKIKTHVVDTLDSVGGQCAALYPEKPIYDIPAHPAISGQDLIDKLKQQIEPFEPTFHLDQQVMAIQPLDAPDGYKFQVTTTNETVIRCKAIVIAAGCGAFGPNRPPLDNLAAYEATGSVQYLVTKKETLRGKKVVIAGGGDSAVDWALALHDIAAKTYVVHRRPKFRAAPDSAGKLKELADAGKIELVIPYQLKALHGDIGQLSQVEVATLDGETRQLDADILLPFFGLAMELGPIADWGLNLARNHIAVAQSTLATSVDGIYAIGDIATYERKLKLILCGFSEAAMAAYDIHPRIYPDTALHFEYSTTKGVPA